MSGVRAASSWLDGCKIFPNAYTGLDTVAGTPGGSTVSHIGAIYHTIVHLSLGLFQVTL